MPERFDWPAIKHDFDTNGFVRIPGFLAPAQAAEAARRLEMFIRDVVPKIPAQEVYYEIEDQVDTIKSITSLAEHDPYFRDLYNGEKLHRCRLLSARGGRPPAFRVPTQQTCKGWKTDTTTPGRRIPELSPRQLIDLVVGSGSGRT